ncbi:MAG: metallophosphoesterase [Lachnospiraceae bacterium]|nr:metallophosphoesterase [Lachnospiraceae bacterium]
MHILHISDIHFRRNYNRTDNNYEQMLSAMTNPLIKLDHCLETAFASHPHIELILISGDLCDNGSPEDYRRLREHLDTKFGNIPVLVTLGNHDNKEAFRNGWLRSVSDCEFSADKLTQTACEGSTISDCSFPYNTVLKLQDLYLISLDSSVFGKSDGYVSPSQICWLKEQLHKIGRSPSVLMTHHHLLGAHESIPPLPDEEDLRQAVQDSSIIGVMCGHTHHCFSGYWAGKPYFTSDGMSFYGTNQSDGSVKFEEKYGYNYYHIENGRILRSSLETFSSGKLIAAFRM